jgi:hypothetical protein
MCFLLGVSPASGLYWPTFRNILSVPSSRQMIWKCAQPAPDYQTIRTTESTQRRGPPQAHCQQHWCTDIPSSQARNRTSRQTHWKFYTLCKKLFHFLKILESLQVRPGDLMVCFDIVSLFTKVPVGGSLSLLSHHFENMC